MTLSPFHQPAHLVLYALTCRWQPACAIVIILSAAKECSSVGRAAVSKTAGRGFESLHSCHDNPLMSISQTICLASPETKGQVPNRLSEFALLCQEVKAERPRSRGIAASTCS